MNELLILNELRSINTNLCGGLTTLIAINAYAAGLIEKEDCLTTISETVNKMGLTPKTSQ